MQERHRIGIQYLEAVTALLHRVRTAHPTAGLLEAADLQWWWRAKRSTDSLPQLFWFDDEGNPNAAVIATDWGDVTVLDPIVMPGADAGTVEYIIERSLAHMNTCGVQQFEFVVDDADAVTCNVLTSKGFAVKEQGVCDAWLSAQAQPGISPLPEDYRLLSRDRLANQPHHLIKRGGVEIEQRLRQTSLYRPDLDLAVLDGSGAVAAYGLFWIDPQTRVGLVEPMRTEDDHKQRGLARHLLSSGIDLLSKAGATRIKLCFQPDNLAARSLYLGAGFVTGKQTVVFARA
jgi:GNAT superfamily N-acetyltransferase